MKNALVLAILVPMSGLAADFFTPPQSSNFISRIMFQSLCKFSFDPNWKSHQCPSTYKEGGVTFDPAEVELGDMVFVRSVDEYFKEIHPKIQVPYIVMTHGDFRDAFVPRYIQYLEDPKVIAWFGVHTNIKNHPKFHPIPHGIWQLGRFFQRRKDYSNKFAQLRDASKDKWLYINIKLSTHAERQVVFDRLKMQPFSTVAEQKVSFDEYMTQMAEHKFTLSPRGVGIDSYRTWEALLVGSIPIVKSSALDSLYKDLPVLVIRDWSEITQEFLEKKYKEITSRTYAIEKLYVEYWVDQIERVKQSFIQQHTQHKR